MYWFWKHGCVDAIVTAPMSFSFSATLLAQMMQDVVGGRVLSVPFGFGSVDVGAQWLVGTDTNPLSPLATLYGSRRGMSAGALLRNYGGDQLAAPTAAGALPLSLSGQSSSTTATTGTTVIAPIFNQSNVLQGSNQLSVGADALSLGSLVSIPQGLAAWLNSTTTSRVLLNTPVVSIQLGDLNATVQIANGSSFSSQYVVCTIPIGVLQDNSIAFSPPLPKVTVDALSQLSSIVLNPVHLRFEEPFWDPTAELLTVGGSHGGWTDFLSMYTFTGEPLLVALPDPVASSMLESQTDEQVVAAALSALRSTYGTLVPATLSPDSYIVTRWGLNPYARGTHSVLAATGTLTDRSTLAEPVGGTLLFAGEAMHVTHPSSLHGAYWSGVAQGMRVVAAMQFPGNDSAGSNATCMADCYGSAIVPLPPST